ncbi:sialidase family protein [Comamonas avium]|uniref:Exo-alpha-sialidase n=1 Tax=Comamonas avium TaxID=2762231 RepID=A0ABR8SFB1_9BURK|nr:hypothetical protein [Comamonas avium]MBD7962161.1 hypothetical protein [Comamonas avium]
MSLYPKEFGARSPVALAKLKTAVATTPGVHTVSVSVPGARGFKSGAFQRVEAQPSEFQSPEVDALYGVAGQRGPGQSALAYTSTKLTKGKGFATPQTKLPPGAQYWVSHALRGLYLGLGSVVRTSRIYPVTYDIPDGLGGMTGSMTVTIDVTTSGNTLWVGSGPRYKEEQLSPYPTPVADGGHIAHIELFATNNPNGPEMQQYEGAAKRSYFPMGLTWTRLACMGADGLHRVVILRNIAGQPDAWGLSKQAYEAVSVVVPKAELRKAQTLEGAVHPFTPPKIAGAGSSNVGVSALVALGGGRVGCVVGVHPFARRSMVGYNPAEIALHLGKEHDRILTWESRIEFKNSKGALYFAVSEDYGATWAFQSLKVFDKPVPAWEGFASNAGLPADYVTEQPLLGRGLYRAEGIGVFDEAQGRYARYDLMFPAPDRAGAWDSKVVARTSTATNMSHAFAMSADIWMLVLPMLDDRYYNNRVQDYVRWRCVVLRTDNRGGTWREVGTPFSDLASEFPRDKDRGYAIKATVLRDGAALVKFYRALRRVGDPPAVRDQVRTVRFALTTDYGLTWSEVLPTGLPSLDATKLGSVMVVKAMRTTSVLAVTAWDEASKAYWVYTSKNDGLTWTQGAKVVDGAFMAMDEVVTVDGTSGSSSPSNLTFLTPLLDAQGQPAKVNAGAPWAHDASKKLPAGPV